MLLADPIHLPALRQGVTTYLLGQDGSAFAPASPSTMDYMRSYTAGFNGNPDGVGYDWGSVDEYLARFERRTALNVAMLIPNGNVRMEVMGLDPRPADEAELRAMRRLVARGWRPGRSACPRDWTTSRAATPTPASWPRSAKRWARKAFTSPTCGLRPGRPVRDGRGHRDRRASGVAGHVSHYNGPADLLLPLIDQGVAPGA